MYSTVKDWITKAGYRAIITFVHGSHHCGYVEIPKKHPLHGIGYSDRSEKLRALWEKAKEGPTGNRGPIVMFLSALDDTDTPRPDYVFNVHGSLTFSGPGSDGYPAQSDGWWYGFDCNHDGDASKAGWRWNSGGVFRDEEYVTRECEKLAEQLREVAELDKPPEVKP